MALLFSAPLTSTVTEFDAAQANGVINDPRGLVAPIPGYLEINQAPDGSSALMSRITPADAGTYGGIRSEIDDAPQANAERWYVWETFFPSGFQTTDLLTFMQIHDSPDGGESPVKYINFGVFASATEIICRVPRDTPNETYSTDRVVGVTPLITGRWVKCGLHARWEIDATGFIEFSYDGRMVANEWFRPSHFPDVRRPYFKAGLYNTSGDQGLISDHSAWYRNVAIWEGPHTAAEVLGAPIAPALMRVNAP